MLDQFFWGDYVFYKFTMMEFQNVYNAYLLFYNLKKQHLY